MAARKSAAKAKSTGGRTGRSAKSTARTSTSRTRDGPEEPAAEGTGEVESRPDRGSPRSPRRGAGPLPLLALLLAWLALAAGIAFVVGGLAAYENLNLQGTYSVDQQIAMATGGVVGGAVIAAGALVAIAVDAAGRRIAASAA